MKNLFAACVTLALLLASTPALAGVNCNATKCDYTGTVERVYVNDQESVIFF